MDIKARIEWLRNELDKHNYNYYVLSNPDISDYDFDMKLKDLSELEMKHPEFFDANSPTQRVGSDIVSAFEQVAHKYPMLSLGNSYNEGEIMEFYNKVQKGLNADFEIVCELKYDGTSVSLTYINGLLSRAVTRGDGSQGDDVTANVRTIRSIPLRLKGNDYPQEFEIRGEILMPWAVFEEINKERDELGEQLFANPRNAGSGTMKQQDPKIVASRKLDAYLYAIMGDDLPTDKHYENLLKAKEWGFKTPDNDAIKKCKTLDDIMSFIHLWDTKRKTLPVATDGIVLKVNSLGQQRSLGFTSKFPRWAIAYKFQSENAFTRLLSVSYQVGRTGAITPVANLEAVLLSGTTVKRASLYNEDYINSLNLHINDWVSVEKGGEIIPKITEVDQSKRDESCTQIRFITECPECKTPLVRDQGEAIHYCPNDTACPPQIKGKIIHFVARRAMNINCGNETVELLYNEKLVTSYADLYLLQWEQLARLERWGERSAQNLMDSIEASKSTPYERVLFALGIRFVGETVAKKLAMAFTNLDKLMHATVEELTQIDEIGTRIAESVVAFFATPQNKELIAQLKESGLQFALDETILAQRTLKLEGLTIVISGTFELFSRDQYKAMIEQNGGKNSGSISSKTSYVFAGANMGPKKLEQAEKLGVPIINEAEFLDMCR